MTKFVKQGSSYHNVPLNMGNMYQFHRGSIQMVHRYVPMYCVSVCSIWLGTTWYIPYRQLVGTPVQTGKANHIVKGYKIKLILVSTFYIVVSYDELHYF